MKQRVNPAFHSVKRLLKKISICNNFLLHHKYRVKSHRFPLQFCESLGFYNGADVNNLLWLYLNYPLLILINSFPSIHSCPGLDRRLGG